MFNTRFTLGLCAIALSASVALSVGCSSGTPSTAGAAGTGGSSGAAGTGGAGTGAAGSGTAGTGTAGSGTAGTGGAGSGAAGTAAAGNDGGAAGTGVAGTGSDGGTPDGGPVAVGPCQPFAKVDEPVVKLSQTGCMDKNDVRKMASIVVPYEVNSPLWSDGADKSRGFVLPAGKKIHVKNCATASAECMQGPADTGRWVMPVGTVMVKNFLFDGKMVETRLLAHVSDKTWAGYSYQWNEAQTEATVLPDDRFEVMFNTGSRKVTWHYPNRFDCNGCHAQETDGAIGPETRQMNRVVGGMNQIDKWKGMGLFEGTGPATPYQAALVLPVTGQLGTATGTLDQKVRSYLHANCAYCHRPDSQLVNWIDFRLDTTVKNMGVCGVTPMKSTVGVDGALLMKPGKPMESVMWLRMHSQKIDEKTRMPQIGTYVVDDEATKLVSDWITATTTCPQ